MSVETAVVLANLGGPDSPEAVEPFLYNIFSDPDVLQLPLGFFWQKAFARWLSRARAAESRANYARIGGRSPIVPLTEAQARLLQGRLGPSFRTYVAMRASRPTTEQAVDALLADGAARIVFLPLYPHRSRTTTISSLRALQRALRARGAALPVHEVCCWPTEPGFVEAWVERLHAALDAIPEAERASTHVLFSAHGLPQSVVAAGDPYQAQVEATVREVMARLGRPNPHSLAFQSRATRAKWLEPSTRDELRRLAKAGVKDVAVVPIAFVTEHLETLYELDMLLRDEALAAGIEGYHRVEALNDSPKLVDALAVLVRRALEAPDSFCRGLDWRCRRAAAGWRKSA
jgi:ferrochelatase